MSTNIKQQSTIENPSRQNKFKHMKQKKLLTYVLIAVVVLVIFAIIAKKAGIIGKEKKIEVTTDVVTKRTIIETITANGKIQPETEVKISPEVSGEIIELNVKEGDFVEKGKLLLRIKPDIYVSNRDQAEASLNATKSNLANSLARQVQAEAQLEKEQLSYERNKKLWEQKTISQSEWEAAESSFKVTKADFEAARQNVRSAEFQVKNAEASLKVSNENLYKTTIYAPMRGTVSKLSVELGERVVGTNMMTGTELLRIADLSRMEVKVDVNENDIVRVSANDTALVEVDAYLNKKFKAVVTEIANSATTTGASTDQVTNFEVRMLLLADSYKDIISENNKNPFRPGMSASVDIQTEKRDNVLTVPIQAVTILRDSTNKDSVPVTGSPNINKPKEIVYVIKDGKAQHKEVVTGIQDNYFIEIAKGLNENEEVITGPYSVISKKLKDGTVVNKPQKKEKEQGKKGTIVKK
jgi:HlyD family secretion protein